MLTTSRRMLNNTDDLSNNAEPSNYINVSKKSWTISNRYEAIVLGDAYCGKSSYLKTLVTTEKNEGAPVMISQDQSEFEFWVEYKSLKAIFKVKDTASKFA
jgi:hypothetical protein